MSKSVLIATLLHVVLCLPKCYYHSRRTLCKTSSCNSVCSTFDVQLDNCNTWGRPYMF